MGRVIRTVLGDESAGGGGVVLGHEHLIARPPREVTDRDLCLDSETAALRELETFRRAGGACVVEMTTVDYGRDPEILARLSERSGVPVVSATGFNKGKLADRITSRYGAEEIAEWMIGELTEGMLPYQRPEEFSLQGSERTGSRAGLIKASSSKEGAGEHEIKVFEAAVAAHQATGAPVSTHTEKGSWALEQARLLTEGGVPPEKVLIGHLDLLPDLEYLSEVASTGVNLGLDQFSKSKYLPDGERIDLIAGLWERGFGRKLILGGDLARRSYLPAYGDADAPGLAHIPEKVSGMLRDSGFDPHQIEQLLGGNARGWLGFEPR